MEDSGRTIYRKIEAVKNSLPFSIIMGFIDGLSKLAVIVGVVVAIYAGSLAYDQIKQNERIDKKNVTLTAISNTFDSYFIKTRTRFVSLCERLNQTTKDGNCDIYFILKVIYNGNDQMSCKNLLIHDLNYLMQTYDYLATLYLKDLVDKDLVYSILYYDLREFYKGFDKINSYMGIKCSSNSAGVPTKASQKILAEDWEQNDEATAVYEPTYITALNALN